MLEKNLRSSFFGLNRPGPDQNSSFSQEYIFKMLFVMTMALSSENGFDTYSWSDSQTSPLSSAGSASRPRSTALPLIGAKLRLPKGRKGVTRTRLMELLDRSTRNHSGTLLVGRTGSGKTTLASDFARRFSSVGWYSIDAGDSDWTVFSRYFRAM